MKKQTWRTAASIALSSAILTAMACSRDLGPLPQYRLPGQSAAQPGFKAGQPEISAFAAAETHAIFKTYDRDGNRQLDIRELEESPQFLGTLDRNQDSKLAEPEIQQFLQHEAERLAGIAETLQPTVPAERSGNTLPIYTSPTLRPNQVELFIDAEEIYPMIFETLQNAQQSIQVDLFVMGGDIGMQLAEKLVERHKAGIDVQLMMDPNLGFVGSTKQQVIQVLTYLKQQGVRFKTYPLHHIPSPKGLFKGKTQIDHNKLFVVDRQIAIMGGMNFFEFAKPNHDLMFRIKGPLAPELSDMMRIDWGLPQKKDFENFRVKATNSAEETARLRLTKTDAFERTTKERLLENIRRAQKSIYVAVLEMSDADVTRELTAAHARGVDVRVLLDPKNQNTQYVGAAPIPDGMPNLLPVREFVKVRLPVRWFTPQREHQELHMKMMLFDGQTVLTGSTNFTTQALNTYRETGFELQGNVIPQRLQAMYLQDWEKGKPITKLGFKQRLVARLIEWLDNRYMGWW